MWQSPGMGTGAEFREQLCRDLSEGCGHMATHCLQEKMKLPGAINQSVSSHILTVIRHEYSIYCH